jgi:hypothetical protein
MNEKKSWKGIYIGNFYSHESSIPSIYNSTTTYITPQFYVVYDEYTLFLYISPCKGGFTPQT